jgi:hypothetical protein
MLGRKQLATSEIACPTADNHKRRMVGGHFNDINAIILRTWGSYGDICETAPAKGTSCRDFSAQHRDVSRLRERACAGTARCAGREWTIATHAAPQVLRQLLCNKLRDSL